MKKTKNAMSKIWVIATLVVLLAIGIFMLIRKNIESATIAMIADQPSTSCTSNIASFTTTGSCGNGMVSRADYICTESGKKGYEGDGTGKNCVDPVVVYSHAKTYCGQTCISSTTQPRPSLTPPPTPPAPSIKPTSTAVPTPVASSSTSAQFSCKVRVFKLTKDDTDAPIATPMKYATPDREIVPGSNRVRPGERYAYLIEANSSLNVEIATISAHTNNLHDSSEPIQVKSTSRYCSSTDSWGKYLGCTYPKTVFSGQPMLLDLGMVVEIQPDVTKLYNTSTNFHVNYLWNGNYIPTDCAVMMLAAEPIVSPTPVATTGPACREIPSPCLKGLIGGSCPTKTVCPSPTAIPLPTPTAIPMPTTRPTPPPTSDPTPLLSCVTEVYKIPSGFRPNKSEAYQAELAPYKVDPTNLVINSGESVITNMFVTNIRGYDINAGKYGFTAKTVSSLANRAPYRIASASRYCLAEEKSKSLSCFIQNLFLRNREQVRPEFTGTLTAEYVRTPITSQLRYEGVFAATPFSCTPVTITVNPTYRQQCYGWARFKWCRTVLAR